MSLKCLDCRCERMECRENVWTDMVEIDGGWNQINSDGLLDPAGWIAE